MKPKSPKRSRRLANAAKLFLLPTAWLAFELARRAPEWTEALFARRIYPGSMRLFASWSPDGHSLAEWSAATLVLVAAFLAYRLLRSEGHVLGKLAQLTATLWVLGGVAAWVFLLSWGFHYARAGLAERLALDAGSASLEAKEVLALARRSAVEASMLFPTATDSSSPSSPGSTVEERVESPSRLPLSFTELSESVDAAFEQLRLPGDYTPQRVAPAKPLRSSLFFSHLGISGIFVPFTGEPSVNALQPDAALPMVVAHEKAHQRGITHEGEASFAGFLACSHASSPPYLRYAAHLYATRALLGEAARYVSEDEVRAVWNQLTDGPRADVAAIAEFWRRYEGAASRTASRINDGYLRTMRVPEGVQSYGTVVELLVALERAGNYPSETPEK